MALVYFRTLRPTSDFEARFEKLPREGRREGDFENKRFFFEGGNKGTRVNDQKGVMKMMMVWYRE